MSSASARPLLRHGQNLDHEGLREEAAAAVEASPQSRTAIAGELGVTREALGKATKQTGWNVARLQRRLIERLTAYRIVGDGIEFHVEQKATA